jgi:hypothetical protein
MKPRSRRWAQFDINSLKSYRTIPEIVLFIMSDQVPNFAAIVPAAAADVVDEERSIPSPKHGEVLIRNHAIAINPVDWKRQAWNFKIPSYPVILGSGTYGEGDARQALY